MVQNICYMKLPPLVMYDKNYYAVLLIDCVCYTMLYKIIK